MLQREVDLLRLPSQEFQRQNEQVRGVETETEKERVREWCVPQDPDVFGSDEGNSNARQTTTV